MIINVVLDYYFTIKINLTPEPLETILKSFASEDIKLSHLLTV